MKCSNKESETMHILKKAFGKNIPGALAIIGSFGN
jgi:hypothetical protein